jgi:hypothetical protein
VHFIKNSINTWPLVNSGGFWDITPGWITDTYNPTTFNQTYLFTAAAKIGVWQALSTKAFGEVISSDSY